MSGPRGWFVTGTDTGVGKTLVAAALARTLRRRGFDVGVLKPAATGVPPDDDADLLRAAAGVDDPVEVVTPLRLREPLAPAVAAARAGIVVNPDALLADCRALLARRPWAIVEGVGGLRVPVAPGFEVPDLVAALGLPLLVVGRLGLGTLNHTALTIEAIRARNLPLAGVILSATEPGPGGAAEATNPAAIEAQASVRVLGVVAHVAADRARDPDALADALEAGVDVDALIAEARA